MNKKIIYLVGLSRTGKTTLLENLKPVLNNNADFPSVDFVSESVPFVLKLLKAEKEGFNKIEGIEETFEFLIIQKLFYDIVSSSAEWLIVDRSYFDVVFYSIKMKLFDFYEKFLSKMPLIYVNEICSDDVIYVNVLPHEHVWKKSIEDNAWYRKNHEDGKVSYEKYAADLTLFKNVINPIIPGEYSNLNYVNYVELESSDLQKRVDFILELMYNKKETGRWFNEG